MTQRNDRTYSANVLGWARLIAITPRGVAAALALGVVLLAGCGGGPILKTNYYKLHLPEPVIAPAAALPATAVLQTLQASAMLTQDRIVYRPSQEEVGFYEYHRWAEDPRTTITNSLLSHLRQRGTFSQIVHFDGRTRGDYMIRGRIEQLEEIDFGGGVSVRVQLSLEMIEVESRKPVWQKTAESSSAVSVGEVRDVVAQMSAAVNKSVEELATGLDAFLRSSAPQSSAASAPPLPEGQR
jgi:ABC-type uncharacterized transport system auxiliary subunit